MKQDKICDCEVFQSCKLCTEVLETKSLPINHIEFKDETCTCSYCGEVGSSKDIALLHFIGWLQIKVRAEV